MYAVAFDLTVVDTEKHHPKGVSQAYTEIGASSVSMDFAACRAAFMLPMTRTWPTSFWQSNRCAPAHGSQSLYATFALSELNNGRTLRL